MHCRPVVWFKVCPVVLTAFPALPLAASAASTHQPFAVDSSTATTSWGNEAAQTVAIATVAKVDWPWEGDWVCRPTAQTLDLPWGSMIVTPVGEVEPSATNAEGASSSPIVFVIIRSGRSRPVLIRSSMGG